MYKNLIGAEFVSSAYDILADGTAVLKTNFNTSAGAIMTASGALNTAGGAAGGTAVSLGKLVQTGGELGSTMGTMTSATGEAALEVGRLGSVSATGAAGAQQLTDSILGTATGADQMYSAIMKTSGGVENLNFSLDAQRDKLSYLNEGVNALASAYSRPLSDIERFNNALGANTAKSVETALQKFAMLQGTIVHLGGGFSSVNGSIMKTTPEMQKLGTTVGTTSGALERQQASLQGSAQAYNELKTHGVAATNVIRVFSTEADNATAATEEETGAHTKLIGALQGSISGHYENAKALGRFNTLTLQAEDAIAAEVEVLAQSNVALERARAVRDSTAASSNKLQAALHNELTSLIEEGQALDANIQATMDGRIQKERLTNAVKEAVLAEFEFISAIDEEKAAFAATSAILGSVTDAHLQFGDSLGWTHDQMRQFIGVVSGAPGALQELASQINSLSNETIGWVEQIKGDKQEVEKVFGEWKLSDAFPEEIRNIMSKAQQEFIAGKAQVTRVADTFGPAIANAFEFAARNQNFQSFREFGPKAAAEIEAGFEGSVPPVLQNVVNMLQNPPGNIKDGLKWMQQIMIEFENAKNPMIGFMQEYLKMGGTLSSVSGQMAASADGLNAMFSALNSTAKAANAATTAGANLKLSVESLNKVTLDNGQQFAQINGQLVELKPAAEGAAGGLDTTKGSAIGLSQEFAALGTHVATVIRGINAQIAGIGGGATGAGVTIKINADITPITAAAAKAMQNVAGIKAGFGPITSAASQSASKMAVSFTQAASKSMQNIAGIKAGFGPVTSAASTSASKLASSFTSAASKAVSAINRIGAAARALPNINRTISYKRVLTGVNVNSLPNLSRTITYRRVVTGAAPRATGFSGEVSQPTLLMVGEQGRERVSVEPISTSVPGMGGTKGGYRGGAGGGGEEKPMKLVGDLYFDTYKVGRIIGRAIAENNV
jgi:hypothetical protein